MLISTTGNFCSMCSALYNCFRGMREIFFKKVLLPLCCFGKFSIFTILITYRISWKVKPRCFMTFFNLFLFSVSRCLIFLQGNEYLEISTYSTPVGNSSQQQRLEKGKESHEGYYKHSTSDIASPILCLCSRSCQCSRSSLYGRSSLCSRSSLCGRSSLYGRSSLCSSACLPIKSKVILPRE